MTETTVFPPPPPGPPHRSAVRALLLFVVVIIPFLPALLAGYTWDDDFWLTKNVYVHAWNGLYTIWNPFQQTLHFYPITFTFLWTEHKIWGLNPVGYHAVNILLHAVAAVLFYQCLKYLRFPAAWLAAFLWAVHPVQAESVAWVAEIKNVLSGVFYFLSAWAFLRALRMGEPPEAAAPPSTFWQRSVPLYALALFAFILALLSKTVTVTLPAALLIILWAKHRFRLKYILTTLPFFMVGLAIAFFSARQERIVIQAGGAENLAFLPLERLIIAGKDVWFYIRMLLVPFPALAIYPRWTYQTSQLLNYLPILGVILLALLLFALRRRISRWPLAAFLYFLVTLSPALGFVNFFTMHYTFVADHYQYLACAGILALAAHLFYTFLPPRRSLPNLRAAFAFPSSLVLAATLLVFTSLTAFYASLFQTDFKLWAWNVRFNPDAYAAQHNLGLDYLAAGDRAEAKRHIFIALHQAPDDDNIQRSVAKLAISDGNFDEAIAHINKAIEIRPTYSGNYILLGDIADRKGHLDEAADQYRKAIHFAPGDGTGYFSLATILKKLDKPEDAAKAFEEGLHYDPGNMIARYNYANTLLDLHRYTDAVTAYEFIIKYQPDNPAVWDNLAFAYHQLGQNDKAVAARQRALQIESHAPATAP